MSETIPQLGRINYPLYAVTPLSCNHVIVSGGGGSKNTGVFDGFVSALLVTWSRFTPQYIFRRFVKSDTKITSTLPMKFNVTVLARRL